MATAHSKAPAIGSAQWMLEERHQANDLVSQELEDFGFSVRNELEWLNEHMVEIFAQNGQNNLDVFKTPGKLRGKTPRTARKLPAEPRQPLADLVGVNSQKPLSPAEQSLKGALHKHAPKPKFHVAEDSENVSPARTSPNKSPKRQSIFGGYLHKNKENDHAGLGFPPSFHASPERRPGTGNTNVLAAPFSPLPSTQDSAMSSQADDIFSQSQTQSTQPTQATQSFRRSMDLSEEERRDTGESFVSAKEALPSKSASEEDLRASHDADAMDVDDDDKADISNSTSQGTVIRHDLDSSQDDDAIDPDVLDFPQPPQIPSDGYSVPTETRDALKVANERIFSPEPKALMASSSSSDAPTHAVSNDDQHDDTVVHHDLDDQMEIDEDVRSPSDKSSPVKPLRKKSSLTFAALPARQPLLSKKSTGERISRTSHFDQNKARPSNLGRFTGGKSLGGSQLQQPESHHQDNMDVDMEDDRPELRREESETTKIHNKTSSQRLLERINLLKQQNEAPKAISQNIMSSHAAQAQSFASSQQSQPKDVLQTSQTESVAQTSQPTYPTLPAPEAGKIDQEDDDDEDWISPIRTTAPAPTRPAFGKSHSADTRPVPAPLAATKPISVSNPTDLSTVVESTTPAGSPTGKKHMDGHLSASKAKFYSALRAAKEKIIGSSATSAQVKLDALGDSPVRPKLQAHSSSDDVFSSSPKRSEKGAPSIFSHLRSPSKESIKSNKSKTAAMPGSPAKEDGRRTRSSSERERTKEREAREKEVKQKQRTEDKLREMREKEQSKASAHHQKSKAASSKTPAPMSSSQSLKQMAAATATKTPVANAPQSSSRPPTVRMKTAPKAHDGDSAEDMPPPPPPKSFLPTTGHKLREPKKLTKTNSKPELANNKPPQKIRVNLNSSRYGPAPPPASRPEPIANAPVAPKPAPQPPRHVPSSRPATAASNRAPSALGKPIAASKPTPGYSKSAPRTARPQPTKAAERPVEKPKAPAAQSRSDLASARPVERMQTVGQSIAAGVNRINVPPVNTAKPPVKRPFQAEGNDEGLLRPAKRPSQQAKMNPVTPAHAHFGKGKIPFAESSQSAQQPQIQFPNGDDIELPACLDSDDDSDAEADPFEQPSWVDTPNLRELLTQQQLVDPEAIFGPIAPLNMEQMFPDRERHKKFRQRTSSAYWANDQVTEEEKRKEREARERLVREGAWTYNPSPRPTPRPGL
ncbi:hypothetical protein DM02DRAFT_672988 [Periconia macrospinosa]|uniref:Inner centromere protein ARK-binding domain-containing protein n=1 Tax=Periconia macrospinosa TaxID=97972 RepID=A0A2V1DLR8_9PLEO|nr:hypothetical protein DM02DRAFT_672988 [Periconia macrospinosa]